MNNVLCLSPLGISGIHLLKIAVPENQGCPHHWKFCKVNAGNKKKSHKIMRMDLFAS
jgi:hypothetical protein